MTEEQKAAVRLRTALDLFKAGERLMRQNLRRRHPEESRAQIEERLRRWMQTRPGAEFGDAEGRVVPWPRPSREAG